MNNTLYEQLFNAKRRQINACSHVRNLLHELTACEYSDDLIRDMPLCQDNCEECRKARRNDPDYQLFLMKKRKLETIVSSNAVNSDLEGRMTLSDQEWLDFYNKWCDKVADSMFEYKQWLKGVDTPVKVKVEYAV